ncbi:MAG: phosphodiester glycosidase family protein [Ignavibacteriales bacterium]|nr:phosphodiester glycosidase family protein [Ignavibacteriales bacterium]
MNRRTFFQQIVSAWVTAFFLLAALAPPLSAQTLKGEKRVIAPGVTHAVFLADGPNVVNVLEVELTRTEYTLESYRPTRLVPTSGQAEANQAEGKQVLAAINADFFSFKTSWPFGNQVVDGKFVLGTASARSHVAIDVRGRIFLDRFSFDGWFQTPRGKIHPITGVNDRHTNNAIVLHNSYSDSTTSFGGSGHRFGLGLVSPGWTAGDTLIMVVQPSEVDESRSISRDEAVLWVGSGPEVRTVREGIAPGDTLLIYLGFSPDVRGVLNSVGGGGRILEGGRPIPDSTNARERIGMVFLRSRHPRTFVGVNREGTRLYLCTVDGRQDGSVGMSFGEMAEFLLAVGAWEAVNLDGGGSTTMVVQGKVVNAPSDKTGEREVANTLQVIEQRGGARE